MSQSPPVVPINRTIPGQVSDGELTRLMELASTVPAGGRVVEVGALYGLASWHIAKSLREEAVLISVDPWVREEWIIYNFERDLSAPTFGRNTFMEYTKDCGNIIPLQAFSPSEVKAWNIPIDMYFEDAVHANPILHENMVFWGGLVKSGGIVCGHDFGPDFPDVISEALELAKTFGGDLQVCETFWYFRKH